MIHKLEIIGQGIWVVGSNMLVESSEKHSIRECHVATLGHAYHSVSNVIGKIEGFSNGEIIERIAQACVWMIFMSSEAYDIFTKNEFPFLKHFFQFGVNHLEWIEDGFVTFYCTATWKCIHTHLRSEFKNLSKVLESESGFDIVDDESNANSFVEVTNNTDAFVELQNKYGANSFVKIEDTIKTDCHKGVVKIWFIVEKVGFDDTAIMKVTEHKRLVDLPFMTGKTSGSIVHGNVVSSVVMINVGYMSIRREMIMMTRTRLRISKSASMRRGIRRIGNCLYAFSCEELSLIRCISFPGYGVLVRID
uniref:Uncharacterized protein n=1 Tax=Tanacetum cinerariifolium TaxID=118510 RepID=A0A6L2NCX5_TANCI|nr:hypothetical protein [Tanacetum cinerariifolium]